MFDLALQALTLSFYFLLFACLARCLILLNKRPFPANAPKFVPGYPVVGALQFFSDQLRFCHEKVTGSATGNYSFYLGRHRVVGVSGPQGRKTFFQTAHLDSTQGVNLFLPIGTTLERGSDTSDETHDSHFLASLRKAFLRNDPLKSVPAAINASTTSTWNRIATKGLINPLEELTGLYAQSTMAAMGMPEVAQSPALLRKITGLVGVLDGTFSAIDMVIPWLLNPLHIPVVIALGRLYMVLWRITREQQRQQQKEKPGDVIQYGMLQQVVDNGRSTRGILKIIMATQFVSQVISPTISAWLLMGLATDAHWMDRIRQEVDQVVSKYRKNGESAEEVLQSLEFDTWYHEFPLIGLSLLETIRLRGEVIPPGAYAIYHAQEVHMDPEIYPDPQRWDPGRFLSDRAEHQKAPNGYMGFGTGRMTCPGQRFARLQSAMVVARFVAMFDFTLCDEQGHPIQQFPAPCHDIAHFAARPESPDTGHNKIKPLYKDDGNSERHQL
ncbi:hypothetical protein FE257_008856 [Aspergillus nanangensis]|uniref:Cytochrome P450 n=1 Tax=Aspergillus nanangensis TaxID=2582783 RepID=A0AAD4CKU1_ASPNN|nr:hypothetical protein FE257_008856 [Aspergillus nanangensis]